MGREPVVRSRKWAWVALAYLALIYALLPWARPIWRRLEPYIVNRESTWFLLAGSTVVGLLCVHAWRSSSQRRAAGVALLLAVLAAYVLLLAVFYRGRLTLEKVHLLEYGVLAYLALNAVRVTGRGGAGAVLAMAVVAAAGAGDELLQKVLPERYFDWYDIAGNWIGGALGAVAWVGASAASPWRQASVPAPSP